ncbi:MAG: DUF4326 domain-containing protein [Blastocatellia bacterium]
MIRIENKKHYRGEGVYIGRPSPLGNPFKIGEHGTRDEVISTYRGWLWRQINLRGDVYRELQRLAGIAKQGDLVLICWCKERGRDVGCHGDVLKSAVMWLNSVSAGSSTVAANEAD